MLGREGTPNLGVLAHAAPLKSHMERLRQPPEYNQSPAFYTADHEHIWGHLAECRGHQKLAAIKDF